MIAAAHELEMKQISARRECRVSYLKSILPGMSLPDRGIGLQNLGASCFINAGIQSLLAIPQLPSWIEFGVSPVEEAFKNVLNMMASDASSITPQPLTDIFYRGQQADAAEFVLGLLETCPSIQASLQGIECPRFQCQHCSYSRPLREDKFLSLQLPLMVAGPMSSVQEALNSYMNAEHVQEGAEEWFCCNEECLTTGRAVDAPMHQTRIVKWPNVLVICLKRWDGTHGLLSHRVYCNETLTADGHAYRLASLITHIGASPTSGHYVAYRRAQHEFLRLDDARATPFDGSGGFFSPMQNEKVYILIYMKEESARSTRHVDPRHPDDGNRRPPTKRAAVELDGDPELPPSHNPNDPEADADSDVILSHGEAMEPEAVTNSMGIDGDLRLDIDSDVILAEEEKTFANGNTNNDQNPNPDAATSKAIIDLCADSNKDDRTKRKVIDLDIDSNEDDKDPSLLQQNPIEAHISGGESPPRNTRRSQSPGAASNADAQGSQHGQAESKAARLQNFNNYSKDRRVFIVDTLRRSGSLSEAMKTIAEKIPEFTTKTKQSEFFLHRSTLMSWFRNPTAAEKALRSASQPTRTYKRKPDRTSFFASLTPDKKNRLSEALVEGDTTLVEAALQKDEEQDRIVPPSTLRRWCSSNNMEQLRQWTATQSTWSDEHSKQFGVMLAVPKQRSTQPATTDNPSLLWLRQGSWTFCGDCGRRQPKTRSQRWSLADLTAMKPCRPCCDAAAEALLAPPPSQLPADHYRIYPTPQGSEWHAWSEAIGKGHLPLTEVLDRTEIENLAVLSIHVDFRSRRGGHADITSKQKRSLTRCRWQSDSLLKKPRGELAARAFTWLLQNNATYRAWVDRHEAFLRDQSTSQHRDLLTAQLLLASPGIEVAARPWLYPLPSLADTDIQERLLPLNWTSSRSKPSIRASFMRKLQSRCLDYARDFPLQCLLYDICMAKTISSVQAIADKNKMSPEKVASDMDSFDEYWHQQLRKMEDICRLEFERTESMDAALPSVFFTVAPAEWRYTLHDGLFQEGSLTDQQQKITLHLYYTLQTLLEFHIFKDGESLRKIGIERVRQWSFRFEFQSRGTLHLHALLWADLLPGCKASDLTGRTDTPEQSPFLKLLEELFCSRADIQCGDGTHNLLRYVAGYVSKASDALTFSREQAHQPGTPSESSRWRQTYRLLCKKSPMEQEIFMEFAGLPMVRHSFSGHALYCPIPGSSAVNSSRKQYLVYQHHLQNEIGGVGATRGLSYLQWLRRYRVVDAARNLVAERNKAGPARDCDCGVAITFPFELLDIFIGAWAATFLEEMPEYRLLPDTAKDKDNYPSHRQAERIRRASILAPDGCRYLKAVLCLDEFQLPDTDPHVFNPDIGKLLSKIEPDLILRGLGNDRIATFKARMHACTLLLLDVRNGFEDPALWSAKQMPRPPHRIWSAEQQEVLNHVRIGTTVSDATTMENARRVLQVAGGPGTGKTEVIIAAVRQALEDNCRVLIAGPIGLLVSMYRLRLPHMSNLTMETVHSAFRITRDADEAYIPPGRLRQYDLIVIDEVSQIEAAVWRKLRTALGELTPSPFVVFVGDFQQLQPLSGGPELQAALQRERETREILFVELKHHEAARTVDPAMLAFLEAARVRQPARQELHEFFADRIWSSNVNTAVQAAKEIEAASNKCFTFLTVTNKGAASLNMARLQLDFPEETAMLTSGGGIPAENEKVVIAPNMRIRLTHNVDKERGFVNGNTGVIRRVLRADVFLLQSDQGMQILVHPIRSQGRTFLPIAYGWATTIRRAQGATLDKVCLCFDRRLPDRGYAYVGVSRAKHRTDIFMMGRIRRSDWRAVNGEGTDEQNGVSGLSESTHSSDPEMSEHSSQETSQSHDCTQETPQSGDSEYSHHPSTPSMASSGYVEPSSCSDLPEPDE